MSATLTAPESTEVKFQLSLADRCDRCGISSQAFAIAYKGDLRLYFCGHHLREFEVELAKQGFGIHDETHKINKKPTNPSDFEV